MSNHRQFYINGQWVDPAVPNDLDVINPSNEEVCATISLGDQADTDAAVAAAKAAFGNFSQTTKSQRLEMLGALAEAYGARGEEMAHAISLEMGAPIDMAKSQQVGAGIWHFQGFLDALEDFEFETRYTDTEIHAYEAIGVAGLITPWNWPMNQVVLKVGAALAAGCTMVLKPSEVSPLSSLVFAQIVDDAGLPAGVFNLVNGDGAGVGSQLSSHPDIDIVSFTGSTRAGKLITKAAADTLKRVSLELGGKGANIIFADASEKAVKQGVMRCMNNTGQSCNAPTRMLVQRARYDAALEEAAAAAGKVAVGLASDEGRHIGPVVSEVQFDKIQGLIETGINEGARLIAGGPGRPEGFNRGYFVRPTVFADVSNDMTIAQEEIFGPVLSIIPFEDEAEAIAIANDTPYGLTNYVQTEDSEKRLRVARQLRSGMVETNGSGLAMGSPFGGYKASGNGREGGDHGIREFLEVKAISGCLKP